MNRINGQAELDSVLRWGGSRREGQTRKTEMDDVRPWEVQRKKGVFV